MPQKVAMTASLWPYLKRVSKHNNLVFFDKELIIKTLSVLKLKGFFK